MPIIDLKYGQATIPFEYDAARFDILGVSTPRPVLTDVQLGEKLDQPIDSPRLEDIVEGGDTVLIVVPDATRDVAAGLVVNLIVRRLIANGSAPHEIRITFATGIHRKVTAEEREQILTPFIANRIKTLDHDPRDLASLINLGETSGAIPIELNRVLAEFDHVVLVGGISYHYFAGFTGGRKLICPGLASARTIAGTHKLAFDCASLDRREGVGTALLEGNAVHEAFVEAVEKIAPAFAISTIVDDGGQITDLFCGDWKTSHRKACEVFDASHSVTIEEKRDLVIVSCGGSPHDLNLIQAHKALEAASHACREGGTIVLVAECRDGLGRSDLLNWFEAANSNELASRLCEKYQVNGQTAWSLLRKAEHFRIKIISDLDTAVTSKMRLEKIEAASLKKNFDSPGYVIPVGAKIRISNA